MPTATENKSFLGRLLLWQKLALLVAATAVPAVVLGCFYFQQTVAGIRQARGEIDGTRYIKALGSVAAELLTHRGREYAFHDGMLGKAEVKVDHEILLRALLPGKDD